VTDRAPLPRLPPTVDVDVRTGALRDYWLARAAQHTEDSYAGIKLSKFPEDLRTYEHLLWADLPDTVVEVGTQAGGSALWFRDRLRTLASYGRLGREPRVVTLDLSQDWARRELSAADPDWERDITLVEGDVREAATVAEIRRKVGADARCLVVEDSAHEYETTRAALDGLAGLISPGGFFVVEDGCVDVEELRLLPSWPRGVLRALRDWLQTSEGSAFEVRRDLELYGISCHPSGFLQRR
jgi:cephalosporin hydroxylase